MRADLVTARTAVAHAAWYGRTSEARGRPRRRPARRCRTAAAATPSTRPASTRTSSTRSSATTTPEPTPTTTRTVGRGRAGDDPGGAADRPRRTATRSRPDRGRRCDRPGAPRRTDAAPTSVGTGGRDARTAPGCLDRGRHRRRRAGRRSRAITEHGRRIGRDAVGATRLAPDRDHPRRRAAPAIRAARRRTRLALRATTCGSRSREGREANLVLFCVDASGSMAAAARMEQVKTAILSLLLDAYQRRDKVGLVTFRGTAADARAAADRLRRHRGTPARDLPAGGRTPLAEGLLEAARDAASASASATPAAGRCWWWSPTAARPHGRDAVAAVAAASPTSWRPPGSPASSSTARPAGSGSAWPPGWPSTCGAEYVPLGEVSADALDRRRPRPDRSGAA